MSIIAAKSITETARRFRGNEDGTIAIIFALTAFVIFLVVGLAIDVARVTHAQRSLSDSLDSAALAAAKGLQVSGLSDAEVEALAHKFFNTNMQGHGGSYADVKSFSVSVDRGNNSVAIRVASEVPTLFGALAGVPKFEVPTASVAIFDSQNIEIGLQLDLTGSMCQPCSKIQALKDAVAGPGGLFDILLPDAGSNKSVRIGLAPFAAGINAGRYAAAVSNGRASANHCVYERVNSALQASEAAPVGSASLKVTADLQRGASACPTDAEVVAITDDKSFLRSEVNRWGTGGSTAGHLGAFWAWGLISPEWANIWGGTAPAPYRDGRTQKYVILMTDGIYNTVGGVNKGDTSSTATLSNSYAQNTCAAMKAMGVTVYTIGFQAPTSAKTNLRNCASSPTKFFDASDTDALHASFRAIAEEINQLRLSS